MLTSEMIKRIWRMEDSIANARAGLWRCRRCHVLHFEDPKHQCKHEDLERYAEDCREVRWGVLR